MGLTTPLFRLLMGRRMKALQGIPGPDPVLPLGNAWEFLRNPRPWEVCVDLQRRHGDYVLLWMFHQPVIVLHDPDLIGEVLDTRSADYYKAEPTGALRPLLTSSSPFCANGGDWQRKRRIDPFSQPKAREWLSRQGEPLSRLLERRAHTRLAGSGRAQHFEEGVRRWVFDAFSQLIVGDVLPDTAYGAFMATSRVGDLRIKANAPMPLPPFFGWRLRRWFRPFRERARLGGGPEGLMRLMREGSPLDRDAFGTEAANAFPGGVFSVTSTLTNALSLLSRHPGILKRLRLELAGSDSSFESLGEVPLLEGVLRETMRLYPAAPVFARAARVQAPLGGHELPRDTRIVISNPPLHRNPEVWPEPDSFRPDRWDAQTLAAHPYRGGRWFFPFGRGGRACAGAHIAVLVLRAAIAVAAGRFELDLDTEAPMKQSFFFGTMKPSGVRGRLVGPTGRRG